MQETQVRSLGWEDPLKKEMATHSSILAWEILWTEEPGRLYSPWGCNSWTQLSYHHHHHILAFKYVQSHAIIHLTYIYIYIYIYIKVQIQRMAWVWYLLYPEGSGEGLSPLLHGFISLILNQIVYASPVINKFVCFTKRHCRPLCTTLYFPSGILTLTTQQCYVVAAINGAGQPCFMPFPLSGPWLLQQKKNRSILLIIIH